MSFLLQCVFYFIRSFLGLLSNEYVILNITDKFRYALICVSLIMTVVGFVTVFKKKVPVLKYLDIPLIFVGFAMNVVFDMFVLSSSFLSIVPTIFGLVPSTICLIREIRWIIDVVKKRRKPQKKNIPVLVGYVLASAVVTVILCTGLSFLEPAPTEENIKLVDNCYEYTEKYLMELPDDTEKIEDISVLTEAVTKDDVFKSTFDESLYFENSAVGVLRWMASVKDYNRKVAYSDIVALRLKTFIATEDYEAYQRFFTENAGYIPYNDLSYAELWENDKEYITPESFDIIIDSYKNILSLCDNDSDKFLILMSMVDFYKMFNPDSEDLELYTEQAYEILTSDATYDLLSADDMTYTSQKLKVD